MPRPVDSPALVEREQSIGSRRLNLVFVFDSHFAVGKNDHVEQQIVKLDALAVTDHAIDRIKPIHAQTPVGTMQSVRAVGQVGPPDAPTCETARARVARHCERVVVGDPAPHDELRADQPTFERKLLDPAVQGDFAFDQASGRRNQRLRRRT